MFDSIRKLVDTAQIEIDDTGANTNVQIPGTFQGSVFYLVPHPDNAGVIYFHKTQKTISDGVPLPSAGMVFKASDLSSFRFTADTADQVLCVAGFE